MYYSGTVTDAATGLPLPGIRVSDGRNIVCTDREGHYALPGWERSRLVFVQALTTGDDDWFVYTGGESSVYDFAVQLVTQQEDFCFFHISDTEINSHPELEWVPWLAEDAKSSRPAFIINTGDLFAVDGIKRQRAECNSQLLGFPIRYAIGNHDYTLGDYGEQLFEQHFGPCWYSFDFGNIHFVTLPIGKGDKPSGYEGADAFRWLEEDLKLMRPDQKLIVLDHDCCADENTFVHKIVDAYMDLSDYGLIGWIMGHFHTEYDIVKNGVHLICSGNPGEGGIDSSAVGYRIIRIRDQQISSEFIYKTLPVAPPSPSLWRTKLAGHCEFSQPILAAGDLLVCTAEYGYTENMGIYRICGEDGHICWFYNTKNSIKGAAAVDGDRVFVQDCGGMLYCLNFADGSLIWQKELPLNAYTHTRMNVLAKDGIVVAGRPRQLFGCDQQTGQILWSYIHRRGGDTPAMLIYDEDRKALILSALWYMTAAMDLHTGEFLWQNTAPPATLRNNTPLLQDGILYGSGQNWFYYHDAATGQLLHSRQMDFYADSPGSAVADGELLYFSTSERGVVAVDKKTLEVVRTFPAGPAALLTAPYLYGPVQTVEGSPILEDDRLIFAASDGMLRVYDKNTAELQQSYSIGAPCITTPILENGCIYTADFDGYVTKFKLS